MTREADWDMVDIYACYGIDERLTISIEGLISDDLDNARDTDEDRIYRSFTLGTGFRFYFTRFHANRLSIAIRYLERMCFDRSRYRYSSDTRSLTAVAEVDHPYRVKGNEGIVWFGTGYYYDQAIYYPYGTRKAIREISLRNLGLVIGANVNLLKHIKPFAQIVYADYPQPELGAGYAF